MVCRVLIALLVAFVTLLPLAISAQQAPATPPPTAPASAPAASPPAPVAPVLPPEVTTPVERLAKSIETARHEAVRTRVIADLASELGGGDSLTENPNCRGLNAFRPDRGIIVMQWRGRARVVILHA